MLRFTEAQRTERYRNLCSENIATHLLAQGLKNLKTPGVLAIRTQ